MAKKKIEVQGLTIYIDKIDGKDFICLTDIAKRTERAPKDVIRDWIRNRSTLLFLETWETVHNADFKSEQMRSFKELADDNRLLISPQRYIETTGAIGLISKSGRYGGTFAHSDIALEFCSWLSPDFKVYFVKEFTRLKDAEAKLLGESWNIQRLLTKANFHLQTAAVRENIVPLLQQSTKVEGFYHASEADQLNLIVFGMTAKEWKKANPKLKGNIRDHATKLELVILNNLQAINAVLIGDGMAKELRSKKLLQIAATQMEVLLNTKPLKELESL